MNHVLFLPVLIEYIVTVCVHVTLFCAHIIAVDTAKKAYLLLYNGVQWAGFILIVMSLLKCLTKGRGVSLSFTVSVVLIYLSGKSPFSNARQHWIRQQCNAILYIGCQCPRWFLIQKIG